MHSSGKTPLIRLAKRDGMAGAGQWGIRIAAILLALVVGGLVILLSGNNPIQGYAIIVEGALGKTSGIRQTVKNFIPLLGTALAIAPCFKMRFWNIGAEGQITAGAMCATYFALFWADSIPQVPLLLIMCAAGAIGGGGLGKIAINYGYYRFNVVLEFFATALLVVLVQILQTAGTKLAVKCDKRIQK